MHYGGESFHALFARSLSINVEVKLAWFECIVVLSGVFAPRDIPWRLGRRATGLFLGDFLRSVGSIRDPICLVEDAA